MSAGVISSRTPEGRSGRCPVCRAKVCVEPSYPTNDAPCPGCGHLIIFKAAGESPGRSRSRVVARPATRHTLARTLGTMARQVIGAVRDALPARKQASGGSFSSESGGVWDSWLDG